VLPEVLQHCSTGYRRSVVDQRLERPHVKDADFVQHLLLLPTQQSMQFRFYIPSDTKISHFSEVLHSQSVVMVMKLNLKGVFHCVENHD